MAEKGKRIGFVDFQLENYHANVFLEALRNDLKWREFDVAGCTAMDEAGGRTWAQKNEVPYYATPAELNKAVDFYMVLAPSNPEVHLALCKMVLPFKKPAYVDKTFAPDLKTAKKIFSLAAKYKAKIQTTSALRYTNVQAHVAEMGQALVRHMVAWGPGRSFGEYAIHPVEMVVSCMGPKAVRLMRRGGEPESQLLIDFTQGRTAVVNVYTGSETPFAASVTTEKGTRIVEVDTSKIFRDNAAAILDFFETGKPGVDKAETLMIRTILDAAENPRAKKGFVKL
jgi:predicted dehydrogenase